MRTLHKASRAVVGDAGTQDCNHGGGRQGASQSTMRFEDCHFSHDEPSLTPSWSRCGWRRPEWLTKAVLKMKRA